MSVLCYGVLQNVHLLNISNTLHLFSLHSHYRLQNGVNLQMCFVNDSSSDRDSDAEDSRTETSLDTPLSPMVYGIMKVY